MTTDVVVVGGGIFGVTAALELRRRGRTVTLLDPGPLPHPHAASTDISKVVRADYGADELYTDRMLAALPIWRAWNEGWERPLFHETGFVILSSAPMIEGSFERESHRTLTARGVPLERLDETAIGRRFPAWRAGRYVDGYFNPLGGWAESGRIVAALLERATADGVRVRSGERVVELVRDGARVIGVRTEAERIEAGAVVLAVGAWTGALLPELSETLRAVAQPVLHVAPRDPAAFTPPAFVPWAADISRTGWYGFCANADGVVKIANHGPGTRVDPAAPRGLPEGVEDRFRAFFDDALPGLAAAPKVGERLCLYCDSPDGDLFIDRHPSLSGLVVAAGGSGHAFKLAPLLGGWIADAVDGGTVARFRWRARSATRFEAARGTSDPSGDDTSGGNPGTGGGRR